MLIRVRIAGVVALVLLAVLALVACGSEGTAGSASPSPDSFAGTWRMDSGDHVTFVITPSGDMYSVVQGSPGSSTYTSVAVLGRSGETLTGTANITETDGQLTLSVEGDGTRLALVFDGAKMSSPFETTLTRVSDSTGTPTPVP